MAKKRKNDTRVDPFSTSIESSSLDALLEQGSKGELIEMPAPSDASRTIKLTCKLIKNDQIASQTSVYGKNRRVQSLLTEKSVSDIINSIKADGRNQHPAICWHKDGKEVVLAGSRRRKACLIAGADYLVFSSEDFNDEDAKILAVSSDQYIAPSLWELGQAYAQTKDELVAAGRRGSYRELADIEGVSHTAIADALKAYENLPHEVLALYPTANHVGREVAKKLIIAKEQNEQAFLENIRHVATSLSDFQLETDERTAQAITKALVEVHQVTPRGNNDVDFGNQYIRAQQNGKNGDMVIKIDGRVMTEKRLQQLSKLLANFN